MKTLRNIIGIHLSLLVICCLIYMIVMWGIGQIFPSAANGYPVERDGKIIGYKNIGQKFTMDKYFWGRPSAVDYNAAASGASNSGPANPDYIRKVNARIDTFLIHNPGIKKSDIPVEMVTASGSGLDPDISPQGAVIQIARIARVRGVSADRLKELINRNTEKSWFGWFGPEKVNVLMLNLELDRISGKD